MACFSSKSASFWGCGSRPRISAVIPCKDRPHELARAIASVRAEGAGVEIVVVDDGSRVPIELEAGSEDVVVVRHEASRGAAAARNAGVAAASGSFVAFLDSDDAWLAGHLQRAVGAIEAFESGNGRSAMAIAASVRMRDGVELGIRPRRPRSAGRRLGDWLWLDDGFVQTSSFVVRREIALRCRFDEGRRTQEDLAWLLALEAAGIEILSLAQPGSVWNDDRRSDRLTLLSKADAWASFADGLPADFISDEARAACKFGGCFEALARSGRFAEAARLMAGTMTAVGPLWIVAWFARRLSGRFVAFMQSKCAQVKSGAAKSRPCH